MSVDIDSVVGSKMNMLTLLREGERRGNIREEQLCVYASVGMRWEYL